MLMVELSPSVDVAYPSAFDFLLIMIHFYTENTIISAGTYLGGGTGECPLFVPSLRKNDFLLLQFGVGWRGAKREGAR